jgi:hypothetical protein
MSRVGNDRVRPTGSAQAEVDSTPRALRVIQYDSAGTPIGPATVQTVRLTDAGGVDILAIDTTTLAARVSLYDPISGAANIFTASAMGTTPRQFVETVLPSASPDGTGLTLRGDNIGRLLTAPYSFPENYTRGFTGVVAGPGSFTIIAPPATRLHITRISVQITATAGGTWTVEDTAGVAVEGPFTSAIGFFPFDYLTPLRLTAARGLRIVVPGGTTLAATASGYIGQ